MRRCGTPCALCRRLQAKAAPWLGDWCRARCCGSTALRTRAQNRTRYIATERQRNHLARQKVSSGLAPPANDDDPPPF
jgi:hypothetical protein